MQSSTRRRSSRIYGRPDERLPVCWYWILRLQARVPGGRLRRRSSRHPTRRNRCSGPRRPYSRWLDYFYYTALTVAALYENASADERPRGAMLLAAHHEQLREWAENYPPTFADEPRWCRPRSLGSRAVRWMQCAFYERGDSRPRESTASSRTRASPMKSPRGFIAARGLETSAHAYLRNARYCYLRWGALGKVRQLEQLYPQLGKKSPRAGRRARSGHRSNISISPL